MSANQYLIDATTRHAVFLQRYAGGESKKALKTLRRLRRDILGRLADEPTQFQVMRAQAVLDDIEFLYREFTKTTEAAIMGELHELAQDETAFSVSLMNKTTSANFVAPTSAVLVATVENAPLSMGEKSIRESILAFGKKKADQVTQIIRDGVALGDKTTEIAAKVRGHIDTLQARQLETLVKTATNSISSESRVAMYKQNSRLLDGYRFVATLDSRTTFVCASKDQQVYQFGVGPVPPLHFGCRSTTIPVVKPEYDLGAKMKGQRPAIGGDGVGQVDARTTYGGWLKRQPVAFVDEALGVERSRLFRSGQLSIDKFTDPTGRVYTLNELRLMNPLAFLE